MDKIKQVTGTVHFVSHKYVSVLDSAGIMHYIDFEEKHLARFKAQLKVEPGDLITLTIKNGGLRREVVDVAINPEEGQVAV